MPALQIHIQTVYKQKEKTALNCVLCLSGLFFLTDALDLSSQGTGGSRSSVAQGNPRGRSAGEDSAGPAVPGTGPTPGCGNGSVCPPALGTGHWLCLTHT